MNANQPLLSVRDLRVSFALDEGLVRAVDGTSFDVMPGQVLGVVVIVSVLAFNLVGDGLRDAADPYSH